MTNPDSYKANKKLESEVRGNPPTQTKSVLALSNIYSIVGEPKRDIYEKKKKKLEERG